MSQAFNHSEEIAKAGNPLIRLFTVGQEYIDATHGTCGRRRRSPW